MGLACPERDSQADFTRPLRHRKADEAENADRRERERDGREHADKPGEQPLTRATDSVTTSCIERSSTMGTARSMAPIASRTARAISKGAPVVRIAMNMFACGTCACEKYASGSSSSLRPAVRTSATMPTIVNASAAFSSGS